MAAPIDTFSEGKLQRNNDAHTAFHAMEAPKKIHKLAVVVVEYHHHALPHIYRMIGRKKLPFSDGLLIHLDAHPDLVLPPALDPALLRDPEHVYDVTNIESWILPAVLAGHISRVVWVRPPWSDQLPDGLYQFAVGTRDGQAKVSCAEPYFLSECMWAPREELQDVHDLMLTIHTLQDTAKLWLESFDHRPYVLDVDLDFYSTQDPFALMFTAEQVAMLQELYHMETPTERSREVLESAQRKREAQLNALKSLFLQMVDGNDRLSAEGSAGVVLSEEHRELLHRLVDSLQKCPPIGAPLTAELIHDAGCSRDRDSALPHHPSSRREMDALLRATRNFLQRLPAPPTLVTVSRSTEDDYCPREDVQFLQDSMLDLLREVYGELDVLLDYEEEQPVEDCAAVRGADSECKA